MALFISFSFLAIACNSIEIVQCARLVYFKLAMPLIKQHYHLFEMRNSTNIQCGAHSVMHSFNCIRTTLPMHIDLFLEIYYHMNAFYYNNNDKLGRYIQQICAVKIYIKFQFMFKFACIE